MLFRSKLRTPSLDAVQTEFLRLRQLLPNGFMKNVLLGTDAHAPAHPWYPLEKDVALVLLPELGIRDFIGILEPFKATNEKYDATERQHRQVLELERFIQRLVRESDHTRDKFFPVTALALDAKKAGQAFQPDPNAKPQTSRAGKPDLQKTLAAFTESKIGRASCRERV